MYHYIQKYYCHGNNATATIKNNADTAATRKTNNVASTTTMPMSWQQQHPGRTKTAPQQQQKQGFHHELVDY